MLVSPIRCLECGGVAIGEYLPEMISGVVQHGRRRALEDLTVCHLKGEAVMLQRLLDNACHMQQEGGRVFDFWSDRFNPLDAETPADRILVEQVAGEEVSVMGDNHVVSVEHHKSIDRAFEHRTEKCLFSSERMFCFDG